MDSPLSPIVTDIFITAFETVAFESFNHKPQCYFDLIILHDQTVGNRRNERKCNINNKRFFAITVKNEVTILGSL